MLVPFNLPNLYLNWNIHTYKYIPAVWEMCLSVDTRNYNMQVLLTEETLIYEFVIQVLDWIFRLFNKQPHKHTNTWTQMPRKQVLTPAVIVVITSQKVLIGNRSCNQSRCQAVLVRARVCTWVCVRMWVCFMDHLLFCPVTKNVLISLSSFPSLSPSTDRQISLTLRFELLYHSFTSSLKISTAVWRSLAIPLKLDEVWTRWSLVVRSFAEKYTVYMSVFGLNLKKKKKRYI